MWNYIKRMNWAEACKNHQGYYDVKRVLLFSHSKSVNDEIKAFARARVSELIARVDKYDDENDTRSGDYSGDDSHGDMMYHVIGLGEAKFNEIMADPSKLNGMDFTESFSYCFPYRDDYKAMKLEHHQTRARECVVELGRIMHENEPDLDDLMIINELLSRFVWILSGELDEAFKGYSYDKDYNRYYEFESNDQMAMFSNYLNDCKRFML